MTWTTTLDEIRRHSPCKEGWAKLLAHLGKTSSDSEPLALSTVLESNGFEDALWCLRAFPEKQTEISLFAVWCARQVQHLMTDPRSIAALDAVEKHARGEITRETLAYVADAADAADAARAAYVAAYVAAYAARAAGAPANACAAQIAKFKEMIQ